MESISLKIPPEIVAQIKLPPKRAQRVLMEELVFCDFMKKALFLLAREHIC
jgi:hypothetical protein